MSKFKGLQVQVSSVTYILKQQLSQGGYSFIYSTNNPQILCKVQVISMPQIERSYTSEKYILQNLQHKNIVKLLDAAEVLSKGDKLGLLFLQNCPRGNLISMMERLKGQSPDERTIMKILTGVLNALELLHVNGVSHRDIKLENILESNDGEFKICDFGSASGEIIQSVTNDNRHNIEEDIQKNTTPMYRSPEQLDLYSGYEIGPKVDIFALGCAVFMLCFRKQPFESRLSSINSQYFLPEQCQFSDFLQYLVRMCFTADPKQRPSATQLIKQIGMRSAQADMVDIEQDYRLVLNELNNLNNVQREETEAISMNFLDKIRKLYHQMTTKTEGWILGFIEQNEEAPLMKYNKYLIGKCWEKRYKVEKVYQVIDVEVSQNIGKSLIVLKILILMHDFLRKGPPEAISNTYKINAITICMKILGTWKSLSKTDRGIDRKRHPFVCLLIEMYSIILICKLRLGFTYAFFIEGNYSLLPFFRTSIEGKILSMAFIEELMAFLERLVTFHSKVQSHSCLIDIQRSIILSLIDEEYCLISVLVHLYSAFKHATNFIEEVVDDDALRYKLAQTDSRFETLMINLQKLFDQARKLSTLIDQNSFSLDKRIIDYMKNIDILQHRKNFNICDYLNYQGNHYGLKIPMSYEVINKDALQIQSMVAEAEKNFKSDGSIFLEIDSFKKKENIQQGVLSPRGRVKSGCQNGFDRTGDTKFQQLDFNQIKKQAIVKNPFESLVPNVQLMEFTHQNLNKNLANNVQKKTNPSDKFKEFLSFASSSNQTFEESIHPVKNLDFSHFEEAKPEPAILKTQNKAAEMKPAQQKAQNFLDLRYFIVDQVTKNANQYIINHKQLEFTKVVGTGHSSEVYSGRWRGQQVAIKKILNKKNNVEFQREIMTCLKLRPHSNLVTLIGVTENLNKLYIISEYCYGGTLFSLLHESKAMISWQSKIQMARQIAQGMLFLHSNGPPIIHRDLKSLKYLRVQLSVLILYPYKSPNDRLHLKIADFGLSRQVSLTFMTGVLGTFHWMAPQIFNNQIYTLQADVFSYGVVLWEIMTRQTPYKNMDSPQALMKFVTLQNGRPDLKLISNECPQAFKSLMVQCWDQQPSKRPDFKTILDMLSEIKI